MTKNEMENETNNKSTGVDQGKGSGANAASSSSSAANVGSGSGAGAGSNPSSGGKSASMGNASSMSSGTNTAGQATASAPGQSKTEERGVLSQIQDSGSDLASKSLAAIGEKTRSTTEGYKSEITGGLHALAEGLRQTSTTFKDQGSDNPLTSAGARYIGDLAEKIEGVSGYFERKDATALLQDVKGFAKRNPTVFVGAAFALGFALSRLIRSGSASTGTRGYSSATRG